MPYDFWNNPIVVSAFRSKYRRGSPSTALVFYPLTLLLIGVAVPYFLPDARQAWPKAAFYILVLIQFFVSGFTASIGTSGSMKSEIAKQTLDFQRITTLTSRQILLGKLLGESAMAFLLLISVLPLGCMCWLSGGFPVELLALAFLALATHTLLSGSFGLVQPVETRGQKGSEGALWVVATPLGIPILALVAICTFRYPEPEYLAWLGFVAFADVVLSLVAFRIMERRLDNPLNPPLGKPFSYGLLVLADGIAVALTAFLSVSFGQRVAIVGLIHLLASLLLVVAVTPWRETLESWVWRFRGRASRVWDSWVANRAENGMALVTFAVIGLVALLVALLLTPWVNEREELLEEWTILPQVAGLTVLLILALGTLYQWCLFLGRRGYNLFALLVVILVVVPHFVGGTMKANRPNEAAWPWVDWLLSVTPSAHYVLWLGPWDESLALAPVIILYLILLLVFRAAFHGSMRHVEHTVTTKLRAMGVKAQGPRPVDSLNNVPSPPVVVEILDSPDRR
jgi:hypothetical protein